MTALDPYGNTATSETGSLNVTFSGANASPLGDNPTANGVDFLSNVALVFVNGIVSVPIVLDKAESANVAATAGASNAPFPLSVTVAPPAAVSFQLSGSATQTQNTAQTLTHEGHRCVRQFCEHLYRDCRVLFNRSAGFAARHAHLYCE